MLQPLPKVLQWHRVVDDANLSSGERKKELMLRSYSAAAFPALSIPLRKVIQKSGAHKIENDMGTRAFLKI